MQELYFLEDLRLKYTTELAAAAAAIIIATISKRKKRRKPRTTWVKPWLQKRSQLGMYDTLLREFREEDIDEYQKFLRMRPETFNVILESQHHIPQARLCFPSTDKTTQFA